MTEPLPADAFVPVPIRWRHVQPGDHFLAPDGRAWHVIGFSDERGQRVAGAVHGEQHARRAVDPDEVIRVLVPVTERDAVQLCRDELGARLIAGRTV